VGDHPWLGAPSVKVGADFGGLQIGLDDPATDPEVTGMLTDPLQGCLDPDAGHGTFIAGLIRQVSPDSNVLAIRVMSSDGTVAEGDLLAALNLLLLRHVHAQQTNTPDGIVDVVSMSMGYYHERPEDVDFDPLLLEPLREFAQRGVGVVAAAGNDSTTRPLYPAAFAPYAGGLAPAADQVPLVSVGALNPDSSVALFSNAGDWVSCYRPGAALVSTVPKTINAGQQPSVRVTSNGQVRQTIDPDGFESGFATWSGTSFAGPVLAGQLAQALLETAELDNLGSGPAVERAWSAITSLVGWNRP
jgi:subtilisin family serine protease